VGPNFFISTKLLGNKDDIFVENNDVWKLLTRTYAIKQWIGHLERLFWLGLGLKKFKSPKPPAQGGHLLVTSVR
jgi:hypothetical protein